MIVNKEDKSLQKHEWEEKELITEQSNGNTTVIESDKATQMVSVTSDIGDIIEVMQSASSEIDIVAEMEEQMKMLGECSKEREEIAKKGAAALEKARRARNKDAGFWKRKNAIEAIQQSGYSTAEAVISLTEMQRKWFNITEKTSKITAALFGMGISDKLTTRTIVLRLQERLENAAEGELTEHEAQEITNLIKQLLAYEDILAKQERLSEALQEIDAELTTIVHDNQKCIDRIHLDFAQISAENKRHSGIITILAKELKRKTALIGETKTQMMCMMTENVRRTRNSIITAHIIGTVGVLLAIISLLLMVN